MATFNQTNVLYLSGVITNIGEAKVTSAGLYYQSFNLYREIESEKGIRTELIPTGVKGEQLVTQLAGLQENQPVILRCKLDTQLNKQTNNSSLKITVEKIIPTVTVEKENHGFFVGFVASFFDPETKSASNVPCLSNAGTTQKLMFTMALNENKKDPITNEYLKDDNGYFIPDEVKWIPFELWNGTAKRTAEGKDKFGNPVSITKGSLTAVSYHIKYDVYKEQGKFILTVDEIKYHRKDETKSTMSVATTNEDADLTDIPF